MKKILLVLSLLTVQSASALFNDVEPNHPHYEAINYLQTEGIVEGYSDGTFKPNTMINRAEFTKIIMETQFKDKIKNCAANELFNDVNTDDWFAEIVCTAKQKAIIDGYPDGSFKPANLILLTEAAKIVSESFRLTVDKSLEPWYAPYLMRLTNLNAIPPSLMLPEQALNRGEMAELIYRLATNKVDESASQLIYQSANEDFTDSDFDDDQRGELLSLINQARIDEGVEPLTIDPTLNQVAQDFAKLMDEEDFFSHLSPNGDSAADRVRDAGYRYRYVGENIAKGQVTAQFAFDTWKESPGHWDNIIKPEYKETGFGQFKVTDDRLYKGYFWVQVFGTKQ